MDTIFNHRSQRCYLDKPIDMQTMRYMLEAATRASNTGNMQVYSIIVSESKEIKDKLSPLHFNQPMIKNAAAVVTFCVDINRFSMWCKLRDAEPGYDNFQWFLCGVIDSMLASQNFSLAAESKGLGICYLGTTTYNAEEIAEVLDLPYGVVPITTVTVGYPSDNLTPLTDRLPLESVVHMETYKNYTEEQINEFWSERENSDQTKKLIKENNLENLAKIFTERRYKKDDNILFSEKFLNFIAKQGFLHNK